MQQSLGLCSWRPLGMNLGMWGLCMMGWGTPTHGFCAKCSLCMVGAKFFVKLFNNPCTGVNWRLELWIDKCGGSIKSWMVGVRLFLDNKCDVVSHFHTSKGSKCNGGLEIAWRLHEIWLRLC